MRIVLKTLGVIGQKALVKTAKTVEISRELAVISCLDEDIGWTKSVGKNIEKR